MAVRNAEQINPGQTSRLSRSFGVVTACCALLVVALMPWSQRDVEPINQTLAELIPPLTPYDMTPTEFKEIVDDISRTEKWFQSLKHAYIQTRSTRTQTASHVAGMRKELQGLSPDSKITPAAFPVLMPVSQMKGAIAFDQHRIAFRQDSESMGIHFGQWDGEKMIGVRDPSGPQGVNYYYKANVEDCSFELFHFFPFACNHSFWFMQGEPRSFGAANLKCVGRLEFCGHDCVVLRTDVPRGNYDWIIGRADHRIYGRSDGMFVCEFKNHCEVENAVFWPMAASMRAFLDASLGANERQLAFTDDMAVDLFDTQNPPPESVYDFQLVKGTEVCDMRFDAIGVYPYDPDRTADEWKKIKTDIDARSKKKSERSRILESMVGTEAAEFGKGQWLNSDPLTFAKLRGTPVRLGFAFVNCGPCANMLSEFANHQSRPNEIQIIVFSAADSREAVEAKMTKYKLTCAAFIPAPSDAHHMGQPVRDFKIEAFPTVVEINGQGRISRYSGLFADSAE